MKNLVITLSLVMPVLILFPISANAECSINGNISVESCDHALGIYCYTLDVTWDMDSPHGLSHFDLLVDGEAGTCTCDDIDQYIAFDVIGGSSDGEGGCTVNYYAELACNGDPSIGMGGIMFKFEPEEGECEPGPTGSGSFFFYSDLEGVPVDEQSVTLVDKAAQEFCTGTLTGVFPGLECDPVTTVKRPFDSLKSVYR